MGGGGMTARLSHLARLESEAIHILREAVAEERKPVMLFSAGKDSTVLEHLALRAFFPGRPPFPLLHIDSTWEFRSLLDFRDAFAREHGFELIVHANEVGRAVGLNPSPASRSASRSWSTARRSSARTRNSLADISSPACANRPSSRMST
jgi:3'-phosphoadenosine 5'-phosphosulfate sulfotransferase (PAPS reductase)/FAD synthetase